jgi:PA14 domain
MPFVLRQSDDESNPRLPDAYGKQLTAGRLVYYEYDAGLQRTRYIIFLCRGGKYGCSGLQKVYIHGQEVAQYAGPGPTNPNWIFHPGTTTTQIAPKTFTVTTGTPGTINCAGHGYANNTLVRVRSIDGTLPAGATPLSETPKYYVVNSATNTFQLSTTLSGTGLPLTTAGTGMLLVWKADAGIDDPVQGIPTLVPNLPYTFSGICYVEGLVPQSFSQADEEPDDFKFLIDCRKVADYNTTGVIQPTPDFSANNARVAADILLQELALPTTRIDWASWNAFKTACDTMVWSRVNEASSFTTGPGLTGKYFNRNDSSNPPSFAHVDPVKTRSGEEINFSWLTGTSPDTGVSTTWYLIRWDGKLRPAYTETYTFTVNVDDGIRLWVGDVGDTDTPLIDQWSNGVHTGLTGTKALTKNQLIAIRVEYFNGTGPGNITLSWSSPSQVAMIIPKSRLYPVDHQVRRYEAHLAIPGAMTAWQAFEEVMERAPGWHWQDVDGKITFLSPNRISEHHFNYDPNAPEHVFNIGNKTFEASPRAPEERVNYQRYEFRDVESEIYAQAYIESHRTDLREQQGGMPSDTQIVKMGVMSRSLAERIAETRMKVLTDPERQFTLRGQLDSYRVSKGDRVTLSHLLSGDKHSDPVDCLVTAETTGGNADEKTYTLLPVKFPFYADEPA